MTPQLDAEFWRPILPYVGYVIIAFCAFIATILYAFGRQIRANTAKEEIAARREELTLGLVDDLRTEVTVLRDERTVDHTRLTELEKGFLSATEQAIKNRAEIETLQKQVGDLTMERDAANLKLDALQQQVNALTAERDDLMQKLDQEVQRRQTAELERIQVQHQLDKERTELNAKVTALESEVAGLKARIEQLNHVKEAE